jgi:hypothetical protein
MRTREFVYSTSSVYAHGDRPGHIDEQGPSLPVWISIVIVVSWIVIALSVVFFVRRLIRKGGHKEHCGERQKKA